MKTAELDEEARQQRRLRAGEYLRAADRLFKSGDYEGAARNVHLAIDVDPRNPYAKAFEDRIRQGLENRKREAAEQGSPSADQSTPQESSPLPHLPKEQSSKGSSPSPGKENVAPAGTRAMPAPRPAGSANRAEEIHRSEVEEELRRRIEEVTAKLQAERAINAQLMHQQELIEAKQKEDELRGKEIEGGLTRKLHELEKKLQHERARFEEESHRLISAEQETSGQELKRLEDSLRARFQEEARTKIAEEHQRLQQEAARNADAVRKRLEAEAHRQLEEERRKLEEWSRKEREAIATKLKDKDVESKHVKDEVRRVLEEGRAALEQERARLQGELSRGLEELRRRQVEEGETKEEELRKQLEEEFTRRLEEERARFADEMRKQVEAERLRIENESRQQAESEAAQRKESEEVEQYEEAVRKAIEEGRRLAQNKKLKSYTEKAREFVVRGEFELALKEVTKAFLLDPEHEEARSLERAVYVARQERIRREEESLRVQVDQQTRMKEIQQRIDEQEKNDREEKERRATNAARVSESFERAEEFFQERSFTKALREIEMIFALDPGNTAALDLEMNILNAMKKQDEAKAVSEQRSLEGELRKKEDEQREQRAAEQRESLRSESLATYRGMLKRAWLGGQPGKEEKSMLEVVRRSLAVDEDDDARLSREVQLEAYTEALRSAWKAGIISGDDVDTHENLRQLYSIAKEDYLVIEAGILQELKRTRDRQSD